MKKVILTLSAIVAFCGFASASNSQVGDTTRRDTAIMSNELVAYNSLPTSEMEDAIVPVTDLTKLPEAVKAAIVKEFPGSAIKSASFDETNKTYTVEILPKDAKETVKVVYTEKGGKVKK